MADATLSVDLAVAAGAALVGGAGARLLRQSVLVGYIAAGLVISPFTPGPVSDTEAIERLADIGVVLLMFGIGVHFSLGRLVEMRGAAYGAVLQIAICIGLGAVAAQALGWSWRESVFFGAAASISGGTVLTKLLGDRGEEDTQAGRLAVAWSVSQDLATVALVVLLAAVAEGDSRLGALLGLAALKAAAFIGGMIVLGARVLPWVLAVVARLASRELFILAVAGLSLGAAVVAERLGLSLALGAFIAGMVVSESDLSYHALGEVLPIRDVFAALFFVSVGMLVDPRLLAEEPVAFAVLLAAVLAKGLVITAIAAWVLQAPAQPAVLAGIGLAQSAEVSFILARQGVNAGAVSDSAFSLILAATAATVVLAPASYALAPALERGVRALPRRRGREWIDQEPGRAWHNHVVICGAGRVGVLVAAVMRQRGQGYVLIESDRRRVEALRAGGEPVIYGNAGAPPVLAQAHLDRARTLVVALPDPVATRQIVGEAHRHHPRLDIVARAVSADEAWELRQHGAAEAVIAERELALELARHTLHRIGVSTLEAQAVLHRLRFEPEPPAGDR